jgi:DNA-directed RNA polymerase subunit H (RpoH/RPB5)
MDFNVDNLKDMMHTCMRFLEVGNFDISKEPDYKEIKNKNFIRFVENRLEEQENELFLTMERVNLEITFRSVLSKVYTHREDKHHRILLLLYPDETLKGKSLTKDGVKKFLNLMRLLDCKEGVLISEKNMAPQARKEFESCNIETSISSDIYNVIFYNDGDFINIVDHISCPKIKRVIKTKEEIQNFEDENMVKIKNIPKIESNDPLVKFFRAKLGNIFEFEREMLVDNMIQNKELYFRIVIPPHSSKKETQGKNAK